MRYLDTGNRDETQTLYSWLRDELVDATYFGCQTGYFSADGLYPLESSVKALLAASGTMHLVVGANEAALRSIDLEYVLELFDDAPPTATTSLTIVAASDVLMHPKTYYVERADGARAALVGSVNLTYPGLSRNIEAAIAIDSSTDHQPIVFDGIRDAITAWQLPQRDANAESVDRLALARLVAEGVLDASARRQSPISPEARRSRNKTFAAMGSLHLLPHRQAVAPRIPAQPVPVEARVPAADVISLPGGAVGIIKRLSHQDVTTFSRRGGTPYIALPVELAQYLPLRPFGKNGEPRTEIVIEARIEPAPGEIVSSGGSTTNITHVGLGTTGTSHGDLRLNYLAQVRTGIQDVASLNGATPPQAGDLIAIEFDGSGRVRLTFISDPTSIMNLEPLLNQPGDWWGWLAPGIIGPW